MAEKEKEKRKTKSVALPADAPESPVSPRRSNARKSAHPTLSSSPEDLAEPDPGSPKGRTPAAKRRVTSLYSEEERARRGSHGGMSVLAIEAELAKFQMFSGCSSEMISELSRVTTSRICNEGQVMQAKGDHTDALLIVLRGTLNIFLGEECIGQMRKGDHVGETFFLAVEDLWNIQLVAAELGMVCDVSREVLQNVLKEFPADKELLNPYLSQPPHVHLLTSERMLQSPIFAQLSESAWEIFRDNMVRRIFFPGETILSEESEQKYLVLLARGAASIEIAGRAIRVERRGESLRGLSQREGVAMDLDANSSEDALHPAVLGDAEFLGLNDVRVCSVKADAECHCWLIPAPVLAKAFANGENESLLRDLLALRVDRGRVDSGKLSVLSIFDEAGCSFEFLRYLQTHFEGRIFVQGKTICDFEIPMGTRVMHIVTSGYAASVGETEQTRTLAANTVFGMMSALGVAPRPAKVKKVVAVKHCYCQLLHQAVVVRALELFPDQRMKVLTLSNGGQETDTADLIERIQNSPFFANTNPDFVMELANAAVDRIFMPGDLVVNEGEVGNSMFILLNGSADVYVSDKSKDKQEKGQVAKKHDTQIKQMIRVGHLNSGAIAGELAMLGISQTRSASIQASTLCVFWEVTQERAMNILDRFPEERQLFSNVIVQNLDFTVTGRLMNLNLFKGFDRKFRNLLALYCERHAFFPDHAATREGENGDKLWIMNSGPAQLQKRGFKVKLYTPGTHFGSDNMLGISRAYIGSLVAMTVCHMLSLSRASYLHALEQYPSKTAHQRLVKEQKKQAVELKDMLERVAIRKGVWQRYQGELAGGGVSNLSDNELVRRLVKAWYDHVRIVRDKRLHDTMNHQEMLSRIAGWKQKQEDAKKRIERKTKMKALIKRNLLERGPLQYLEEQKPKDPLLQSTYDAIQDTEPWAEVTWPRSAQQIELLKDWPQPRPSPYYTLRVWEVVRHELRSQDSGSQSRMLPLLGKRPEEPPTPSPEPVPEPSPRKGKGLNRDKFMSGGSAASASPSSTGSDGREGPAPPPRPKLDDDARSDASSPSSPRGQISPWGPMSPTGGGSAPLSRFQISGRKAMMMAKMIKMRTVGELSTGEVSRGDNGTPG